MMEKQNSFSKYFTKIAFVTGYLLLTTYHGVTAQVVSKVVNGATSIDITLNTPRIGKLYYVLSTSDLNSPTAAIVKQYALASTTTSNIRIGALNFSDTDLKQDQIRLLSNLPFNKTYYLYCVFESNANGLEVVEKFNLYLPLRQPEISFLSSVTGQVGAKSHYLLYKPENAYKNPTQPQPLLLYFHGDGEKGTDITLLYNNGLPRLINNGQDFDFIVASPQVYWPIYWDRPGYLEELINKIKTTQNIDTNRIYITGISGGGGGIYYYTGNYPSKVAAMIPVSAVNILTTFCGIKDIAFWGFHNQNDPTVGVGNLESVVNGINACSPKPLVAPLKTIYPVSGHDSWTVTYNNSAIYAWLLTKTKNDKLNSAPSVNAGIDLLVADIANLNGSASDDQLITSYLWEKVSGLDATILNKNSATTTVKDLVAGTYVFKLTATDNSGASVSDLITVVSSLKANKVPIVNAGVDISVVSTVTSVNIVGTASDSDGSIASMSWTKISGPSVSLSNSNSLSLVITNVLTGNYVFRLTVTDNLGASSYDEMNLTITSPPIINQSPIVNAGTDISLVLTVSSITITGTASDSDGTISSYVWTEISGQVLTLTNANSPNLILSNIVTGNYVFRLTVTDNSGASTYDEMNLVLTAPPIVNQIPLVNAGSDINTILTVTSLTLPGIATDPDGSIVTLMWTQISGPSITLLNTTTSNLILTNVLTGSYVFRFTAMDNSGASVFDDINVTITPLATASVSIPTSNGLAATYFKSTDFTGAIALARIDTTVNFDWSSGGPGTMVGVNQFSARWQGRVKAPITGSVVFSTSSDDGIRLWVNNALVIDNWSSHWLATDDITLTLTADQLYDIKLEYFEGYGLAVAKLFWTYSGQSKQIIPKSSLLLPSSSARLEAQDVVEKNIATEWSVYPNPVSEVLYIEKPMVDDIMKLSIQNLVGAELFTMDYQTGQKIIPVNVSSFKSGIYFLEILTSNEKIIKRIIIE